MPSLRTDKHTVEGKSNKLILGSELNESIGSIRSRRTKKSVREQEFSEDIPQYVPAIKRIDPEDILHKWENSVVKPYNFDLNHYEIGMADLEIFK